MLSHVNASASPGGLIETGPTRLREKKNAGSSAPMRTGPAWGLQRMPIALATRPVTSKSGLCGGAAKVTRSPTAASVRAFQSGRVVGVDRALCATGASTTVLMAPSFYTPGLVDIRTVGVVGCGLMGSGIAEVCARSGYTTIVREIDDALLARGRKRIEQSLTTAVER